MRPFYFPIGACVFDNGPWSCPQGRRVAWPASCCGLLWRGERPPSSGLLPAGSVCPLGCSSLARRLAGALGRARGVSPAAAPAPAWPRRTRRTRTRARSRLRPSAPWLLTLGFTMERGDLPNLQTRRLVVVAPGQIHRGHFFLLLRIGIRCHARRHGDDDDDARGPSRPSRGGTVCVHTSASRSVYRRDWSSDRPASVSPNRADAASAPR